MSVSIITVVYNQCHTIERCVQSVLNQSYANIEYIVIDGNSKDGTVNVLNKYRHLIKHFVSEPDKGIYDALNKALTLATGDIVGILHADDIFADKNVVEKIVMYFEQNPQTDCIYGDIAFVREKDPSRVIRYYSSAIFKSSLFKYGFMPAHPSFFCYRKYFMRFGNYRTDLEIAADFDLLLRFLYKHRLKGDYLPLVVTKMNMGGKSTRGIDSTIRINREIRKILKEHGLPSNYFRLYLRYFIKIWEFWKRPKTKFIVSTSPE